VIGYLEYLKVPTTIGAIIIGFLLLTQLIGEIIELKGKTAPEFMKWRKYFKRKQKEKKALKDLPNKIQEFNETLSKFNQHYSPENIKKRNDWMKHIDDKECLYDEEFKKLSTLVDKVNQTVVDIQIDNKRSQIIDFASMVSDDNVPVTREQFNRILKMYDDYERIIEENGMTNGEIEIAHSIIVKSYKKHMENHSFVEDMQEQ
jgi:predicted transcriptional regulator